jgi:hypothetical protein
MPQVKSDLCSPDASLVNWRFRYRCWRCSKRTPSMAEEAMHRRGYGLSQISKVAQVWV